MIVGLCMERSLEMVVGLLGILKAGGAYLPLDPNLPSQRLGFMIANASVPVVLTTQPFREKLPEGAARIILLDTKEMFTQEPTSVPMSQATAQNLAYVLYTSGSTGEPKGVAVTHRNIARLVCNVKFARLDAEQTFLHHSVLSFDLSTLEIWGPLVNGGCCAVAPPGVLDARAFERAVKNDGVTCVWLTASLFNVLMDAVPTCLAGVSQVVIGGEALSPPHIARAQAALPGVKFINGYGPTEATVFACCYAIEHSFEKGPHGIPIGQAITDTQLYVLDDYMEPVPVGVPGQLYIGGGGVARAYLGRPELTAACFVANPFGEPGSRIYRTGDQACYRLDGNVEFIGRTDHQVKLRGFRIELGEVESALATHPQISKCVVVVYGEDKHRQLVAYVVGRQSLDMEEVRSYLQTRLPEYMVPSVFIQIPALPLMPSGKLNRKALPSPNLQKKQEYVAPSTETEIALAEIWSDVLEVERIGLDDGFFDLGGQSLLATQVLARVRERFGVDMPLRVLFGASTLRGLARQIDSHQSASREPVRPRLVRQTRQAPLSYAQERLWFLEQLESSNRAYNESFGLQMRGALDVRALERALGELVRRHEMLRTRIETTSEGKGIQIVDGPGKFRLEVVDLSQVPAGEREARAKTIVREETSRPLVLSQELFRVRLLRLAPKEHWLLFCIHHIAWDGFSYSILEM